MARARGAPAVAVRRVAHPAAEGDLPRIAEARHRRLRARPELGRDHGSRGHGEPGRGLRDAVRAVGDVVRGSRSLRPSGIDPERRHAVDGSEGPRARRVPLLGPPRARRRRHLALGDPVPAPARALPAEPVLPGRAGLGRMGQPGGGEAAEAPRRRPGGLSVPRTRSVVTTTRSSSGPGTSPTSFSTTCGARAGCRTASSSRSSGTIPSPRSFDEYLETTRKFTPDVERRLTRVDAEGALLAVRAAAGYLQSLEGSLAKRDVVVE